MRGACDDLVTFAGESDRVLHATTVDLGHWTHFANELGVLPLLHTVTF